MLSFFDSNCVIGRRSIRRSGYHNEAEFYKVDDLLFEMDYSGIGSALVYHSLAKEYDPMTGNMLLMDEIKNYKQLHPCWVVMPNGTKEIPEPEQLINEMLSQNVRAVRIFPSDHLFSLSDWCSGELMKELEKHEIVVIVEIDQIGWEGLYSFASHYPRLPIIVTNLNYRVNRYLYPILERCKNLYVEISGYQIHKGLEAICARFGAGRLIFGTRMPYFTPGPALTMVNYLLTNDTDKEMIAGGNLCRLTGYSLSKKNSPEPTDFKSKAMIANTFEDETIIDAHCHMGSYFNFHIPDNDAKGMIEVMDRLGIKMACISPHIGITPDFKKGNDMALRAMRDFPGRFFAYITVNGNYPEDIKDEIDRCYQEGMRAFKIHPSLHGYPASGENLKYMWEFANEKGLPVLSHTWAGDGTCSPSILGNLAEKYPNVPVILGHSGGTLAGYDEAIAVTKKHKNVFLETCCSNVIYGMIERFVREVGADRILFGSDMPFVNANAQIGKILYAKISDSDKRKILGLNMQKIISNLD